MAFLEIVTRTIPGRSRMLRNCQNSLKALVDPDWKQTILTDEQRLGVAKANAALATHEATGDWVWVLDDDDLCAYHFLLGDLREIVAEQNPDVVMVRVFHAKWGMLPPHEQWERRPIMGQIGGACVLVRRDVWQAQRCGWSESYAGDFWFINRLWDAGLRWAWLPVIAAYQPQQSNGAIYDA